MKKKNRWNKVFALFFTFTLLFSVAAPPAYAETAAEKYKRLKEELTAIDGRIEDYKEDKQQAENLRTAYADQKVYIDELIEFNKQEIAKTEEELKAKESEVAEKRESIDTNEALFKQRLGAIYRSNDANALSTILNVNSFSEFLVVSDSLKRISEHDTDLLTLLNTQKKELETQQAEIDGLLGQLNDTYAQLDEQVGALANNIAAQDAAISKADAEMKAQQQAYDETSAEAQKALQEMQAITQSIGGSSSGDGSAYQGGAFQWPVPGYYSISVYFGQGGHRGIDIFGGGIYDKPIVAIGAGTVIVSSYAHYSYGNYVVVDHGGGLRSLYAHCTQLLAPVGTQVGPGTPVATVGNTGYSFGNHLHLEIHQDGVLQNPLSYLQ